MHVHHGLGIQRLHIKVVGIATSDCAHGSGMRRQNRSGTLSIKRLRIRVALRKGRYERLFDWRSGTRQALRASCCFEGDIRTRSRQHGHVVVRTHRQGNAPRAHGTGWVEFQRTRKGSRRFIVIEPPKKPHSLVKIALRLL